MIQLLYASKQYCLVKNFLVNRGCQKFRHMWLQDSYLLQKLAQCVLPILLIQQKPFAKVVYNCRLKGPALLFCFLLPFYQSGVSLKSQLFLPPFSSIQSQLFLPSVGWIVQLYLPPSASGPALFTVRRSRSFSRASQAFKRSPCELGNLFDLEEWFVCHPELREQTCWQFLWIFHAVDFWLRS